MGILSFRPLTDTDLDFLRRLYAGTRDNEMALLDWSEEQKRDFLNTQFEAQHKHYQEHYANAAFDIILLDDQSIGRVYLDRWKDEFRLIDIALIKEIRNQGIGTFLLKHLLHQASNAGLPVRIHVEHFNPALRALSTSWFSSNQYQWCIFLHGVGIQRPMTKPRKVKNMIDKLAQQ